VDHRTSGNREKERKKAEVKYAWSCISTSLLLRDVMLNLAWLKLFR